MATIARRQIWSMSTVDLEDLLERVDDSTELYEEILTELEYRDEQDEANRGGMSGVPPQF